MSKKPRDSFSSGPRDDDAVISKPGLETSCMHISQLFIKQHPDIATEITGRLMPHIAKRLGIKRKPLSPIGR